MERDFLGLKSKESAVAVKEEAVEVCKDSAFSKGLVFPCPLANKVSAIPHFMSFKVFQEEKTAEVAPEPLTPPGFMAVSSGTALDTTHKCFSGETQNFAGTTIKQQMLGGIPFTSPHSVPFLRSVAGTTEPWSNPKPSGGPAQLTLFYGGSVIVYDDISPEKAQAIMLLAGNGSSAAQPRGVQGEPKMAGGDGVVVNHAVNTPPSSALSSPVSVSSHPVGSGSVGSDEVLPVKPAAATVTAVKKLDQPRGAASLGHLTATTMMPSAVPQSRKASLARFLEKRKERVMNTAPYNLSKKSPECTANSGSNHITCGI